MLAGSCADLIVEQGRGRRAGRLFDLGDDLVGAAFAREAVDEVAREKKAQLTADIGEIEAEIGNALAVDVHTHLR